MVDLTAGGQAEFESESFDGLKLEGATIRGKVFDACRFTGCHLRDVHFVGCRFHDCLFQACDLSLMHVAGCSFASTRFADSQVIGVNWTEAEWPAFTLPQPVNFRQCAISYSTFFGVGLPQSELTECLARDVDFAEADLTRANCTYTNFSESRFFHTNLTEADFSHASNYAIDARVNALKKTKFTLPEAMSLLRSLDIVLSE